MSTLEGGYGTNGGYDKSAAALKSYAANYAAMYWPGLDSGAYGYNQKSNKSDVSGSEGSSVNSSPPTGASPPTGFGFSQSSPTASAAFPSNQACPFPSSTVFPTPLSTPINSNANISHMAQFPGHSTTPHLPGATPKKKAQPVPPHLKDDGYFERRRRNNESARRSRESRRVKEDQTHYKLMLLEAQNTQLQQQVLSLRAELERTQLFYASQAQQNAARQ